MMKHSPEPNAQRWFSRWIDWRWAIAFMIYIGILVVISILAYRNQLPQMLTINDKLGHFVLFGLAGFLSHRALKQRSLRAYRLAIPLGPLLVGLLVIIDEGLQSLSANRSSGMDDLWANWIGIIIFIWIGDWLIAKWSSWSNSKTPNL